VNEHLVNNSRIERDGDTIRLTISPTPNTQYSNAQLDDYSSSRPFIFSNAPPKMLRLRARFSHPANQLNGTAGFGFWNHPFVDRGLLAPPRSVWFFFGSRESDLRFVPSIQGHGFKTAMLDALSLGRRTTNNTMFVNHKIVDRQLSRNVPNAKRGEIVRRLIFRLAYAAAQRVIHAREKLLDLDLTEWHKYELDWQRDEAIWRIDDEEVFRATYPPRSPLGFVTWIDNYRAEFTPDGRFGFAYVDVKEEQWLEIQIGMPHLSGLSAYPNWFSGTTSL
jgi:hypothetical protein